MDGDALDRAGVGPVSSDGQRTERGGLGHGNLLDDGARTYRWDAENQLIGIGYKASPAKSTAFRYDGLGRRLAIVEGNGTASTETRYLWCGTRLCQARNAADVVTRRYFPEGEAIPQGDTRLYYGMDQLGSVRDVSSAQTGARVATYDYDPYGNQIASTGRISVDFRYAGMFYHPQSGLYLTNYRAYDPKSARWLSKDPIKEFGGLNLYVYVDGGPIGNFDPLGLVGLREVVVQGIAVGPFDAYTAGKLASEATEDAKKSGLPGEHNGPADAYRHCMWSCKMAKSVGAKQAQEVGNIHEQYGQNPEGEICMDLHNNAAGRGASGGQDCAASCRGLLKEGKLQTFPAGAAPDNLY